LRIEPLVQAFAAGGAESVAFDARSTCRFSTTHRPGCAGGLGSYLTSSVPTSQRDQLAGILSASPHASDVTTSIRHAAIASSVTSSLEAPARLTPVLIRQRPQPGHADADDAASLSLFRVDAE